ncbi:hypothetical protein Dsin_019791 [Dipteronia sinensis]|uniref:Uncharacterized protein n=1 Tax=Dipteronia sinensis TaxID=43782 RepID=A0AAE0A880_9ROSI|nr:hypothetical protein Dsin_019791 [Dipteronia sinensis]
MKWKDKSLQEKGTFTTATVNTATNTNRDFVFEELKNKADYSLWSEKTFLKRSVNVVPCLRRAALIEEEYEGAGGEFLVDNDGWLTTHGKPKGIHAEIARVKHEYWSSFAPLPVEIVLAAGQRAKENSSGKNRSISMYCFTAASFVFMFCLFSLMIAYEMSQFYLLPFVFLLSREQ